MIEKVMIPLEEAIEIILNNTPTTARESVQITDALHRALAEDVIAKREHPPWDNSAMDGYAVRWQDIHTATLDSPVKLKIVGEIQAGGQANRPLQEGEAIQIMTGAPTPVGADTVVPVENTSREDDTATINISNKRGSHIRLKGEDIKLGAQVLPAGTTVRPSEVGVLATAAYSSVLVHKRPSVSVLATGNELAEPGEQLPPEKIINSNSYSVSSLVKESGADCITLPIAKDTREDLDQKTQQALKADVALIIGGVSMGKYDYVKESLEASGCQFKFWRVAMRPGHPVAFGLISPQSGKQTDTKLVFGLPGNPVSCVVAFYQFVRPALRKMMGHRDLHLEHIDAVLEGDFNKKPGRTHLARATTLFKDGKYHTKLALDQGSGILTSFVGANSLAILPAERETFKEGDIIKVQLLPKG